MQHNIEVKSYIRNNNLKKDATKSNYDSENYRKYILIAIIGFCISRVYFNIGFNFIDNLAPFGILYIIIISSDDLKNGLIALAAVITGYISISSVIKETPVFIISAMCIVAINILIKNKNKTLIMIIDFIVFMLMICINGIMIFKHDIIGSIIISTIIGIMMIPIGYITTYGYKCFKNLKIEKYMNNDELISIEIFISLVLVGIGNINIFNLEIKNILIVAFVVVTSYVGRGTSGITSGVIAGIIFGIITNKLYFYLGILAIGSLFIVLFRETGKLFSYLIFNCAVIGVLLYIKEFNYIILSEILIGSSCVLFLRNILVDNLRLDIESGIRSEDESTKQFNKIKSELMARLRDFTGVLSAMSSTLNTMVENEKLISKNKGDELVDNLAERVCKYCDYKTTCWKREVHETYSSFKELIQSYEEGNYEFPECLKRKCLKESALSREAEELVKKHIADEMLKNRLAEGRHMLANHIKNMSETIGEIVCDFSAEVVLNLEAEKIIKTALIKANAKFEYLLVYNDKDARLNIKIEMKNCGSCNYCIKEILPIINKAVGRKMKINDDCSINASTGLCEIHIVEAQKFYIESGVALSAKMGEKYTGDSYSFGQTKDGHHMVLLCDGMGSGSRAGEESRIAIEMVEKFSESGFSEKTAINTINSIMNIKFSEEEKFSTLDLQKINLYDGSAKFLKVGAMESFIKRGNKIEVIDSKTLPFGVLDDADIEEKNYNLKPGDFIITISDGILDNTKNGDLDNSWLVDLLKSSTEKKANVLASRILDTAKGFNNGKAKDDMTVVVSKVYCMK
ncbi:MAG: stage II sporulation protein E [Sarcina sp.]